MLGILNEAQSRSLLLVLACLLSIILLCQPACSDSLCQPGEGPVIKAAWVEPAGNLHVVGCGFGVPRCGDGLFVQSQPTLVTEWTDNFISSRIPNASGLGWKVVTARIDEKATNSHYLEVDSLSGEDWPPEEVLCPQPNLFPVAVCPDSPITSQPLETLQLDGSRSFDPGGRPLSEYRWSLLSSPRGSTSQPEYLNKSVISFYLDLATPQNEPYLFQLEVVNFRGQNSVPCQVEVRAIPNDDLHVQLVWDTNVVDVDLHLLNPQGTVMRDWFSSIGNDCYYLNKQPQWGPEQLADDPRLDIDNTEGFGPENINIFRPSEGLYSIGVHYFCDDDIGPTHATVRVFCRGALAGEFGPRRLGRSGYFWEVAQVSWPTCAVYELTSDIEQRPEGCHGF